MKLLEIKTALRNGPYAWPGGYPLYFLTSDGATLSFDTVRAEWREIVAAHLANARGSGWHIAAVDINYEDAEMFDEHTGLRIESAYAEDDAPEEPAAPALADVYNLDGMVPSELETFWRRFYGDRNPTMRALARYAAEKRRAMFWRQIGRIGTACKIEEECERLYNALPAEARW